jgi:excisionase family DNA binding protein
MESSLAYSIAEACARSGIGRTAIYDMIKAGQLNARKRGRRTLILADDLRRCLEALPLVKAISNVDLADSQHKENTNA